jgi:hypothetical protein
LFASAMISTLLADTRLATLLVMLSLSLPVLAPPLSSASEDGKQPAGSTAQSDFSADDFNWREMVPYLFVAAGLPGEEGIKAVLENSSVLRAYVRNEVRSECGPDKKRCTAKRSGSLSEEEVSKRIDQIVQEGILVRHKTAFVDYPLAHQPFPFSQIAAVKTEKHPDAYFMLSLADRSYSAAQVQAKYGAPDDTDIFQWYSVFKYRLDSRQYTSKAVFEIDPVDGAVIKIAISLKTKKSKSRH